MKRSIKSCLLYTSENALATYYPAEQVIEGYTIKDGGLWMIVKLTTYSLRNSVAVGEPADADYVKYDNDRTEASMLAFLELSLIHI